MTWRIYQAFWERVPHQKTVNTCTGLNSDDVTGGGTTVQEGLIVFIEFAVHCLTTRCCPVRFVYIHIICPTWVETCKQRCLTFDPGLKLSFLIIFVSCADRLLFCVFIFVFSGGVDFAATGPSFTLSRPVIITSTQDFVRAAAQPRHRGCLGRSKPKKTFLSLKCFDMGDFAG